MSTPEQRMSAQEIADWIIGRYPLRFRDENKLKARIYAGFQRKNMFKAVDKVGNHNLWTVLPEMRARLGFRG